MSRGYLFFFRSILCLIRHLLLRLYPYTECSCGITNRNNFFGDLKLKTLVQLSSFNPRYPLFSLAATDDRTQFQFCLTECITNLDQYFWNSNGAEIRFSVLKRQQIAGHSPFKASFSSRSQNGHFFLRLWVIFLTFFQIG